MKRNGCWLLAWVALVAPGCVTQIMHEPNGALIDKIGEDEAQRRLIDVLERARNPTVLEVRISPTDLSYLVTSVGYVAWGGVVQSHARVRMPFTAVSRFEIYGNARTFVFDTTEKKVAQIDFASVDDACAFADLMTSFKVRPPGSPPPKKAGEQGKGPSGETPR